MVCHNSGRFEPTLHSTCAVLIFMDVFLGVLPKLMMSIVLLPAPYAIAWAGIATL